MLTVLLKMHLTQLQNGGQGWVFDSNFHSYFSNLIPNPPTPIPLALILSYKSFKNIPRLSLLFLLYLIMPTHPRVLLPNSHVQLPLPPMMRKAKYSFACFSTFAVHVLNLCHGWMDTHFLSYITMCKKILF